MFIESLPFKIREDLPNFKGKVPFEQSVELWRGAGSAQEPRRSHLWKSMKSIQIIDGARNCTYDIFAATEKDFRLIFPGPGQDIEFIEDFIERVGKATANDVTQRAWSARIDKKQVAGIHGTLFFELSFKKPLYPSKREAEMVVSLG